MANPNPDAPGHTPTDPTTSATPPAPKRWNTTPNWKDPFNPPSPGDPYWDEWIAANPDYRGQGYDGPTPAPSTPPPGPGKPPGPNLLSPFTGTFTPPATRFPGANGNGVPDVPVFHPPTFTPPAPFAAPTADEVLHDPGYLFSRNEGEQALQAQHAAQGVLNTGGSLKDLIKWGQDFASTRYNDVYGRKKDIYNENYQTQYVDPYNFAYKGALDSFAPQMQGFLTNAQANQHANDNDYTNAWNRFLFSYDQFRDQRDSTFDKTFKYVTA